MMLYTSEGWARPEPTSYSFKQRFQIIRLSPNDILSTKDYLEERDVWDIYRDASWIYLFPKLQIDSAIVVILLPIDCTSVANVMIYFYERHLPFS